MNDRRRGLGRGLGALIPTGIGDGDRPSDIFFRESAARDLAPEPLGDAGDVSRETSARQGDADTVVTDAEGAGIPPDEGSAEPAEGSPTRPQLHHGERTGDVDGLTPSGLGARPVEDLPPIPGAAYGELALDAITPNPRQPRRAFDEDELAELAQSIQQIGVLQPVVVRPASGPGRYELVMGERRWRAAQLAGLDVIPAIVKLTPDDAMLRDALLENLQRSQLNPLEEAAAYQQLIDDFDCTHDELAARIGRSRPQITNTLRLLRLPPLVARRLAAGVLTAGHGRALLGLSDAAAMERLAQRIVAEGLSVRTVEELVAVGEPTAKAPRAARTVTPQPELDALAARLSDRFDTRVRIITGRHKGRLTLEFASRDDLERILGLLTEGEGAAEATVSDGPADGP